MATADDFVNDALLEGQLVQLWQDNPCLYVVQSVELKNRDLRITALKEIGEKLQSQWYVRSI